MFWPLGLWDHKESPCLQGEMRGGHRWCAQRIRPWLHRQDSVLLQYDMNGFSHTETRTKHPTESYLVAYIMLYIYIYIISHHMIVPWHPHVSPNYRIKWMISPYESPKTLTTRTSHRLDDYPQYQNSSGYPNFHAHKSSHDYPTIYIPMTWRCPPPILDIAQAAPTRPTLRVPFVGFRCNRPALRGGHGLKRSVEMSKQNIHLEPRMGFYGLMMLNDS